MTAGTFHMQMVDACEVKCMPVGATTVMVAGETPNDLNSDKLGEFARRLGHEVNGRPIYAQVGNDNRMLWCSRDRSSHSVSARLTYGGGHSSINR